MELTTKTVSSSTFSTRMAGLSMRPAIAAASDSGWPTAREALGRIAPICWDSAGRIGYRWRRPHVLTSPRFSVEPEYTEKGQLALPREAAPRIRFN
jgi:hypothetical protein